MAKAKINTPTLTGHVKRAHGALKRQYYKRMPDKKHHRVTLWVVFFTLAAVIAAQLLYPLDRALPFARLGGERIGFEQQPAVAFRVNELFQKMTVEVAVDGSAPVKETVSALGGEIDTEASLQAVTEYPFWQRWVPFSMLFQQQDVRTAEIRYSQPILKKFAETTAKKLRIAPKNARLTIEDGEIVAVSEARGKTVTAEAITSAIKQYAPALGESGRVYVKAEVAEPQATRRDLEQVRVEAEQALARRLTITADGKAFSPSRKQIASWLELSTDANKAVVLTFSDAALKPYLDSINKVVGKAAGTTTVRVVDGAEARRDVGKAGRRINDAALTRDIKSWIMDAEGSGELTAQFVRLAPTTTYTRSYTSSQAGLRAYVADASREQNAAIVVQQTNGQGWSASARGAHSMPSASTYKLYVAWVLFTKMDQGKIGWNDKMLGTTVSDCFNQMTIASTNACAEQWLSDFGRSNINNFLYSRGYSRGTNFTNPTAAHTTANDLAKYLRALESGSNISGAHRDRLLRSLSIHPYRKGVPSGSQGRVWDKVGFLWDYVHDAAIVHRPKGNYIIVVMTKGRSYATIADITRRVERIMYP